MFQHVRSALARLSGAFTPNRADDDLAEELQSHIDMATAEYVRRGMDPVEARPRGPRVGRRDRGGGGGA